MSPLSFAAWLGTLFAFSATMGLIIGRSVVRRTLALALVAAAVVLPWLSPAVPWSRALLGLAALCAFLRFVDLVREQRSSPPLIRAWLAVSPFDMRKVERVKPGVDPHWLLKTTAYAALCAAGWYATYVVAEGIHGPARLALRWTAGLVFIYAMVDSGAALFSLVYRLGGVQLPIAQDAPAISRTVQEFWSRRWNRPVHEWLMQHCFAPLARARRPMLGIAAAFLASTAIHVFLAALALDLWMTASMGAFFVVQGIVLVVERRLGVARWRRGLQHTWTVTVMLATSPLFVEPFLRIFA